MFWTINCRITSVLSCGRIVLKSRCSVNKISTCIFTCLPTTYKKLKGKSQPILQHHNSVLHRPYWSRLLVWFDISRTGSYLKGQIMNHRLKCNRKNTGTVIMLVENANLLWFVFSVSKVVHVLYYMGFVYSSLLFQMHSLCLMSSVKVKKKSFL